ncbi:hypothetical protein PVAND_014533 [Polypedilum vanderplanki]|uniref:Uncharacterized protein n=1 Tax=Polypedilum vanderplanki TaxID=319348 RepID=A0A9J6BA98_POLVA|nr:hypothetical protein PVAND_014533 [Polypedilum vanderplanki]
MWVAPNLRQSRSKQTGSNLESTNVDETQSDQRSSRGRNQSSSVSRQPNSRLRTTRNTLASSSVRNRVSVDRQTTSTGLRSFKGRQRSRSRIDQRSSSLSLNQSAASNHSSISALSDINQQEEIRHDLPVQNVVNEGEDVQQNQEDEVNRRVKEYFDAVEGARDNIPNGRHVFSASLRYAKGTEIIERTIGMLTQHDQQTGRNLKDQLTKMLEIVGLTENDIYATCTDQGANMLRAADLVIEAQEVLNVCRELERDENADSEDEDQARDEVEMLQQERDDDDNEDDEMHQNLQEEDDILNLIQGPLCKIDKDWKLSQRHIQFLQFLMKCWDFIDEYVQSFEPVHQAMLEYQRADITMSDFYLRWARMQAKIGTLENGPKNLATKLHDSVKLRARKFFECDAFVAALLLDKRFTWSANHEVLNANLREKGIQHLEKLYQALNQPVCQPTKPEVLIREEEEAANAAELEFQRLIGGVGDRRLRS